MSASILNSFSPASLGSSSHYYPDSLSQNSMSVFHYQYSMPPTAPPAQRPFMATNQGTSSAFSASANPDEDWTKISDLAERRRIQNRIAQRNYRKKLKRRLAELEAKEQDNADGSDSSKSSTSPPTKKATPKKRTSVSKPQKSPAAKQHNVPVAVKSLSPSTEASDDFLYPHHAYDERARSISPFFSFATYPPPEEQPILASYGSPPPTFASTPAYPSYFNTASTLPSLGYETTTTTAMPAPPASDSGLTPYVSYGFPSGGYGTGSSFEPASAPSPYDNTNNHNNNNNDASPYGPSAQTPSLSHSIAANGDSDYEYPTTPQSSASPDMNNYTFGFSA